MSEPLWSPGQAPGGAALPDRTRLFALEATAALGAAVAERLARPLSSHEERGFEDGEH